MGFLDLFKRWKLTQQGLSSGKKRRVHSENPVIQAIEDSLWVKLALFTTFIVGCAVLVLQGTPTSAFAEEPLKGAAYALILALLAVVTFQMALQTSCKRNSRVILVFGGIICHLLLFRLSMALADRGVIPEDFRFFFAPFAFAPMIHGILLGRAMGSFSAVFVTLICCLFAPRGEVIPCMMLSLIAGISSVLLSERVRRRLNLLQSGFYVGAVILALGVIIGKLSIGACFGPDAVAHIRTLAIGCSAAFGTAVLTALLVSGFLPLFESMFHLTTDITWLELSDLNHPLLRRMQLEAPGTFHHSLVVAALAESAAEKIGANAPLCRVCSYFHDVGKLNKPAYFIENQHEGGENPHHALTPTMSALIIIAHVKDGVDLAVKHKLNPRIIHVIQEHHGDSLVSYFYHRAQEQRKAEAEKVGKGLGNPEDLPAVNEQNFRYPGQRPTSRESGIICLADTIESASRSLKKPTPARIRGLVEELVRAKIHDGQLDECPLTLAELARVKDSFCTTLRSMMHSRIDYPKDDAKPPAGSFANERIIPMAKPA